MRCWPRLVVLVTDRATAGKIHAQSAEIERLDALVELKAKRIGVLERHIRAIVQVAEGAEVGAAHEEG